MQKVLKPVWAFFFFHMVSGDVELLHTNIVRIQYRHDTTRVRRLNVLLTTPLLPPTQTHQLDLLLSSVAKLFRT